MSSQIRRGLSKIAAYLTGNQLVAGSDPSREASPTLVTFSPQMTNARELCVVRRIKSACPNIKAQTAPAPSASSKRASSKKPTLQKQLQIIMRPSRRCAIEPKS